MKNKRFTLLLSLICIAISMTANNSFIFFTRIPKYESISLKNIGDNMTLTIDKNYQVKIYGSKSGDKIDSYISASGNVSWDIASDRLFIDLSGEVSGSYSDSKDIYETTKKVDGWGIIERGLTGGSSGNRYKYERTYSHTEYYSASGRRSFSKILYLSVYDDGRISLSSGTLGNATLTGDVTRTVSFNISDSYFTPSYGSTIASSENTTDEFGRWQWNNTRTHLYLKSVNSENTLNIAINDSLNTKSLYFECKDTTMVGTSISTTDDGYTLKQFMIGFEDGIKLNLSLQEINKQYYYAEYNRFLATLNKDANSIIDQLKNKKLLLFAYEKLGVKYTDIYILEGLEIILNYL